MCARGWYQRHGTDAKAVCVLHHHTPFIGVYPKLREFLSDLLSLKHGCVVIWEFFALWVANARSVFKMKEIFHHAYLRPYWLSV